MSSMVPPSHKAPLEDAGDSTRSVHAGVARPDRFHAIPTPIIETATYTFAHSAEIAAHICGQRILSPDGRIQRGTGPGTGCTPTRTSSTKAATFADQR